MTHKTHAIRLGGLRLAIWGGSGYLMSTRGFAVSLQLRGWIGAIEMYHERRK